MKSQKLQHKDDEVYGTFGAQPVEDTAAPKRHQWWRALTLASVALLAAGALVQRSGGDVEDSAISLSKKSHKKHEKEMDYGLYESSFVAGVNATNLQTYLHAYASVPHICGSQQDYETAVYTKKQFESFGIEAEIKEYYTLLSYPVHRRLAIVAPESAKRELNLTEEAIAGDSCTSNEDVVPPFLAYTASGNITGSVVFANFGRPQDFQWLVDHNVTLEGKIALIRYGGNFRGLKVMGGESHGMVGVLIYSDPKEDGFVQGPVYPEGPWRPADSFQRGSSQYLSVASGDPLTPGFPSNKDADYLTIEEATNIPHIPALPLSYAQATYILESLGGTAAPADWQGGLTLPHGYVIGDDEATVLNLDLEMDNHIGPIWDVVGTIKGDVEPDELVLIGNHRDAWVCGAVDPSSGSAALNEIARGFGELLKQGWKPRRTIKLLSWDGEEYGLLGSTEYAEDNEKLLKEQAVAYINVDAFLGANVNAGGTPSISAFLLETAKSIPPNQWNGALLGNATSLYDQWTSQTTTRLAATGGSTAGFLGPEYQISFLGSGSDFTPFYQHLGIISANLGFSIGGGTYGVYHSNMDSLAYMEGFGDPGYQTHTTIAQWWGLVALRLANEAIVPFDFSTYASVMTHDLQVFELQTATLDLGIDYTALHESIQLFEANADAFQASVREFADDAAATGEKKLKKKEAKEQDKLRKQINQKLVRLERYLLLEDGLPHREWYKHAIFGPGYFEGYAGTSFPGISDALAFGDNATTVQAHVDDLAQVVANAAEFLVSF